MIHRHPSVSGRMLPDLRSICTRLAVRTGMPETFLADLTAATDAYETAVRGRDAAKQDNSEAPGADAAGLAERGHESERLFGSRTHAVIIGNASFGETLCV